MGFAPGERVTVCLRPEALELAPADGAADGGNLLYGVLRLRNYLGWLVTCEIELRGGAMIRAQAANPRSQLRFTEGGPIAIRFSPEDVLLLHNPA